MGNIAEGSFWNGVGDLIFVFALISLPLPTNPITAKRSEDAAEDGVHRLDYIIFKSIGTRLCDIV